jgi:hypothetical protein
MEAPSSPPTLRQALRSAVGYFIVSVLTTIAGYTVANFHSLPASTVLPGYLLFFAVLLPAYVNRAILYELSDLRAFVRQQDNRAWLKQLSIDLPLLLLVEGGVLSGLLVFADIHMTRAAGMLALSILLCAAPLYLMEWWLTVCWPHDRRLASFRYRSLLPAFATCLLPFTFGYSGSMHPSYCFAASGLVIGYWLISMKLSTRNLSATGLIVCVAIVVVHFVGTHFHRGGLATQAKVLFFGITMTLAMGVSEAWRVTTRLLNNRDLSIDPADCATKSYFLGGTNLATSLFLPVFLLSSLYPSTTPMYLCTISILLAMQYIMWFRDRTPTKSSRWTTAGVITGFLLPICVSISSATGSRSVYTHALPHDIGSCIAVFTITGGMFAYLAATIRRCIIKAGSQAHLPNYFTEWRP